MRQTVQGERSSRDQQLHDGQRNQGHQQGADSCREHWWELALRGVRDQPGINRRQMALSEGRKRAECRQLVQSHVQDALQDAVEI
jgi:hypothetical protein